MNDRLVNFIVKTRRKVFANERKGSYAFKRMISGMLDKNRYYKVDTRVGNMFLNPSRDSLQSGLFWSGEHYEKGLDTFIKTVVKDGDCVFDIGAHIGYYSFLFSNLTGKTGNCYSFEPQKNLFEIIKLTMKANGISNIIPFNTLLSNKTGKIKFFQAEDQSHSSVTASIGKSEAISSSYDIDSITIDDFIRENKIPSVKLMKIDVEGAEFMVLEGAKESLKNRIIKNLLIELHEEQLKELGSSIESLISYLEEMNFKIFYFDYKTGLTEYIKGWKPSSWHIFVSAP